MVTIVGGMLVGMRPRQAAEFSFLLGLPTLGGATVYSTAKRHQDAVPLFDQFARHAHLGQCGQPQKVELEQANALNDRHGELGHGHVGVALGRAGQGNVLDHRPVGDHHAGGVHARVPRDALDLDGHVDPLADVFLVVVFLLEVLESPLRAVDEATVRLA